MQWVIALRVFGGVFDFVLNFAYFLLVLAIFLMSEYRVEGLWSTI